MRARTRDRRVYLAGHPILFTLLAATRSRGVLRVGGTLLVHDAAPMRAALTRVPLDRTAPGTTGGEATRLLPDGGGVVFDAQGDTHRNARRDLASALGAAAVTRLRPVWTALLERRLAPLSAGATIDLVATAAELAGATAAALLGSRVDPVVLADAARDAAATAARAHLPGPRPPGSRRRSTAAAARLTALLETRAADPEAGPGNGAGWAAMVAVAAITTTVAALPRAAAWAADDELWEHAGSTALTDELLRVTAPSPLLPRTAAGHAELAPGCPVRAGDRMLVVARHAAGAHNRAPDPGDPAPARIAQLVFGAGSHACPGARLARAQLTDFLAALAPLRPVVVKARADRRAALPGWRELWVRAS